MDYEDHKNQIIRRQNEEISRQNAKDAAPLFDFIFSALWFCILYFPFVAISIFVGRFAYTKLSFEFFSSGIVAVIVGFAAYFLVNWIEAYSDKKKKEGNKIYIPIKIVILLFVSGAPFLIGYQLGASVFSGDSPILKNLVGSILGLAFAIPAYQQVILSNKDDR